MSVGVPNPDQTEDMDATYVVECAGELYFAPAASKAAAVRDVVETVDDVAKKLAEGESLTVQLKEEWGVRNGDLPLTDQ